MVPMDLLMEGEEKKDRYGGLGLLGRVGKLTRIVRYGINITKSHVLTSSLRLSCAQRLFLRNTKQ